MSTRALESEVLLSTRSSLALLCRLKCTICGVMLNTLLNPVPFEDVVKPNIVDANPYELQSYEYPFQE